MTRRSRFVWTGIQISSRCAQRRAQRGPALSHSSLLSLNGEDLRQRPLEERRAVLSPLVAGVAHILFSEALAAEGALVFTKACELGLEGIVSKRLGSRYSKNPAFVRG
jgi:hypothetical protein